MPKAGTHTVRGNSNLTKYDSIKNTVGNKPTNTHRASGKRPVTASLKAGSVKAASAEGGGSTSPALPKASRDYDAPQS